MTEKDLIDLDFQKVDITDADSQNGYDYFYYQKEICPGITLHSVDSIDIKDNNWYLNSFDLPDLYIESKDVYKQFIEIIKNTVNPNV